MNKKRLLSLGLILCTSVLVCSVVTTAAWFIGASYLQVSNFDISIGAKKIEISPDNETYFEALTKEDLIKVDYFIPCTSMYSDTWISEKAEMPLFRSNYTEAKSSEMTKPSYSPIAEKGFFSQLLYFKANDDCYVLIDSDPVEGTRVLPNEDENKKQAKKLSSSPEFYGMKAEEIEENLNSITKSIRFSLLVLGSEYYPEENAYNYYIIDPFKTDENGELHTTRYGGVLDLDNDGYYDSYNGKEIVYGQVNDSSKIVRTQKTNVDSSVEGEYSCFNAKHSGEVEQFDEKASLENGLEFVEEPSYDLSTIDSLDNPNAIKIPLKNGLERKIVLSIYIEGWDLDNTNVTMYASFILQIAFKMSLRRD